MTRSIVRLFVTAEILVVYTGLQSGVEGYSTRT